MTSVTPSASERNWRRSASIAAQTPPATATIATPIDYLFTEFDIFSMTQMRGPVESWLRFLTGTTLVLVVAVLFIWVAVLELEAGWWWGAGAIAFCGVLIVVTYERLIGW